MQIRLFAQELRNSFCARFRHRDHDENHRDHHQTHQDLHDIGEHAGQLAGRHRTAHDQTRAEPRDEQHARIHAELHERHIAREGLLRLGERAVQQFRDVLELLGLVILADICLDHADTVHVFLYDRVQTVINLEHTLEYRADHLHQNAQTDRKNRQHGNKDERHVSVDLCGHDESKDQHDRASHCDARAHLKCVLHVRDIRRQTGNDRAGGELIDVGERKVLHRIVHIVSEIARKAGRSARSIGAGRRAEYEREHRTRHEDKAVFPDGAHVLCVDALVDELRHDKRNEHLHDDLEHNEKRREKRILFELTHAFQQLFYHFSVPPCTNFLGTAPDWSGFSR